MAQKLLQIRMDAALSAAWDTLKASPNMERDSQAGVLYRLIEYYNDRANHEYVKPVAPKPLAAPKPTAEQRKLDERKLRIEQYRADKLARYRETGIWPRVEMTSDALPGWKKEPMVNPDNGKLRFTDPDRPNGGFEGWEPPEDYPHMAELEAALKFAEKAMLKHNAEPVDADEPKLTDFVDVDGDPDHEAFEYAKTKYQQAQLREYFAET